MNAKALIPLFGGFLLSFSTSAANAQSLGDPVVSITFGAGSSTHSGALPADSGTTSYTYSNADFPQDGSYTIENSTAGSGSVWWSATDHTGNTGGYMMVVNASVSKTDYFYKRTVKGLCSNTKYQFSAWIVNLLRSNDISPPNITFSIEKTDGTVIESNNTNTIPRTSGNYQWIQKAFNFTVPAGVSDIVIKMTNNSAGGAPANDLAIDDITFSPYGPDISASFSSTGSSITASDCADVPQTYTLSTGIPAGYSVLWQSRIGNGAWSDLPGAAGSSSTYKITSPTAAGTYYYRVVTAQSGNINSAYCRSASNVLTLTVGSAPVATATVNTPVCAGTTLSFSASAGVSYKWTGPNGFTSALQSPAITPVTTVATGTYYVTIKASSGCEVTTQVNVTVNAQPVAVADVVEPICEGSSVTLHAGGGSTYLWSPAKGLSDVNIANPVASPADTTLYTVTVSNGTCTSTATVQVNVLKKPIANAGPDRYITQGQSTTLNGSTEGTNVSYYWTPADNLSSTLELKPTATPTEDITYTLHVVSNEGCGDEATDEVFVRVYKKVTVPNTFTPNGDGVNDTWNIEALDTYPTSTTQVFNRYGTLVYKSTGYPKAWDGTINGQNIPGGTYYYVIDLKNGKVMSGWVMVAR
ncbi:gliding motility-associated C-terminal domain-containing protein [Mucilaginibacter celer]|uniref:Gliding motility-associated C-terminal domain-containing protein n=1 Tax=Mucilaginibacter celer TaxID=2305508 RepID=A0A494W5J9_9SPHI|nr:gliding motility-associated C-terminal domain-containing protein [Mucilaginibacter celer]AYL98572.1 gliding motility-associated C-terminal domain-containing protein [Mucilaginibacter celer]